MTEKPGQTDWEALAHRLGVDNPDVAAGKMMSAPAVTLGGKVFAFYASNGGQGGLGCRLGRDFDVAALGLSDWQHLAPFKSKPPMKDWIVVGTPDIDKWYEIAASALNIARHNAKARHDR